MISKLITTLPFKKDGILAIVQVDKQPSNPSAQGRERANTADGFRMMLSFYEAMFITYNTCSASTSLNNINCDSSGRSRLTH